MAVADLPEVYGGPYADEIDNLMAEVNKAKLEERKPDFNEATKDWATISAGAKKWIKDRPDIKFKTAVGPFVRNVKVDYEADEKAGVNKFPEIVDGGGTKAAKEDEDNSAKSESSNTTAQPGNPEAKDVLEGLFQ